VGRPHLASGDEDARWAARDRRDCSPIGDKKRRFGEAVPCGRMGTAQDCVGMAIFLDSAKAATSSPKPTTSTAATE
jgi:hypothetical protein